MAGKIAAISVLDASKNNWAIVARVIRLWYVRAADRTKSIISIDMILADVEGVEIHANVRKLFVKKFEHVFEEGSVYSLKNFTCTINAGEYRLTKHAYKVNIQGNTKVSLMTANMVPLPAFKFTSFDEILGGLPDTCYLIDVIGVLSGVGTERTVESSGRSSKMNVIELENSGLKLTCTLWGAYADEVKMFLLASRSGITMLSLFGVKVKEFQGKASLQNSMHATRIVVNPDIAEAAELRGRFLKGKAHSTGGVVRLANSGMPTLSEDFLGIPPRKTISQLSNLEAETLDGCVIVLGTIDSLIGEDDWWYLSCNCHRAVYPDSVAYYCNFCCKRVLSVTPRYRIKVTVADDTGAATFVIFDRAASALFNKDCSDLIQQLEKAGVDLQFPNEISGLVGEEYLFKIEIKDQPSGMYEQSYRVTRLTKDVDTIKNFKKRLMDNQLQCGSSVGSSKVSSHASHSLELEPYCSPKSLSGYCNLATAGSIEQLAHDSLMAGGNATPPNTAGDIVNVTPSKRNLADVVEAPNENYSAKLMRPIKIEKP